MIGNVFAKIKTKSDLYTVLRRATDGAQGADRTVYTPNELFWLFNKPDDQITLPFYLGTDENGGFVVNWDAGKQDEARYDNFVISQPMCDALGLDDYMTYMSEVRESRYTKTTVTLSRNDETALAADYPYSALNITVPSVEVTNADDTPYNPSATHAFRVLLKYNGRSFFYINQEHFNTNVNKSFQVKVYPEIEVDQDGVSYYVYNNLPQVARLGNSAQVSVESFSVYSQINLVIPNLPFQPMLGSDTDSRILASLRLPFDYSTVNTGFGSVSNTNSALYGDLLFNSDSSRSYLRITTDQQLFDCDVEARLIRRTGEMDVMMLPQSGQFQVKLRFLQTQ